MSTNQNNPFVRSIRKASREMVRELGILNLPSMSMPRCHALIEVGERGCLTVAQLVELLHLDKSSVSRVVSRLEKENLLESRPNAADKRQKPLVLTEQGKRHTETINHTADQQVSQALSMLSPEDQGKVLEGLSLYSRALSRSRMKAAFTIRPIEERDNPEVAHIIRTVLTEYGANKPGYAFADPEVDCMFETYNKPGAAYFVVEHNGKVVGGGGYSHLRGSEEKVCELQKMYFLTPTRGFGLGADILKRCLEMAVADGYKGCYLETLQHMDRALKLYRQFGFQALDAAMGNTGHCGCNSYYYKAFQ